MSGAGDPRVRWSSSRHAVPTMVSNRDLDALAKQISQFVALATALAGRLRGPTIVERAAPPGLEQRPCQLDGAVLAGQDALTQFALSQHQPPSGTRDTGPCVPCGVHS